MNNRGSDAHSMGKDTRYGTLVLWLGEDGLPARFIDANEIACRMLGYTTEMVKGVSPDKIIPGLCYAGNASLWEERGSFECELIGAGGGRIAADAFFAPFTLDDRSMGLVAFRERTVCNDSVESVREMAKRYQVLVETTPDLIYSLDEKGRYTAVNQSVCNALGLASGEILGKNYTELNKQNVSEWQDLHRRVWSGEVVEAETSIELPGGETRFYEIILRPIIDENGVITGVKGVNRDISIRKRALDELQINRARLLEAQRIAQLGNWDWDITTNRVYWSDQLFSILGLESHQEDVTLDYFLGFLPPDAQGDIKRKIGEALKGSPYEFEHRFTTAGGSEGWLYNKGEVAFSGGRPVRMFGTAQDITRRKETELALRRRVDFERVITGVSTKLANLSESEVEAGIYEALKSVGELTDADRSYVFQLTDNDTISCTHEWCREGISPEIDNLQNVPSSLLPWWWERMLSYEQVSIPCIAELPAEAEAERDFLAAQSIQSLMAVPMVVKKTLLGFVGIDAVREQRNWTKEEKVLLKIIGETISSVLERVSAQKSLRESEERYRQLIELFPDIVIVLSEGKIVFANQAAMKAMQSIGNNLLSWDILDYVHPDIKDYLSLRTSSFEHTYSKYHKEEKIVLQDGSTIDVEISALPFTFNNKPAIQAIVRDITERKMMEGELLKAAKLESVGILAGGIAHDFNNLLTVLLCNISLARNYAGDNSRIYEKLSEIEKAALQTRDLTRQLQTFAKGGTLVKETASLSELVFESAHFALSGSRSKPEFSFPPDLWTVEVDIGQISQVINNLVINAHQAMPQGGTIRISAKNLNITGECGLSLKAGKYVDLTLEDEGAGIAPESLLHIFDPFYTTKPLGTGLGLTTCYSIVQKHGGCITVESVLDRGTTFHIFLPAVTVGSPPSQASRYRLMHGQGRILFMDDEEAIRRVAGEMLSVLGYEADFAADGNEALMAYKAASDANKPYDAVVMDLTVPGAMGGLEAVRKLLEVDAGARVIVSSGYSSDQVLQDYGRFGFSASVAKPYQIEELGRVLHNVLKLGANFFPGRPKHREAAF